MNFGLSKEIYGGTPWMMDPVSFNYMSSMLKNFRNGVSLDVPDIKYNSFEVLDVANADKIVTRPFGNEWMPGELENNKDFRAVVVLNLNGPITKNGGASSVGMQTVSEVMLKASQDKRVVGFVLKTDSGGGASSAVELMIDTINEVKLSKPVYSVITKGGMAASAAYGIISASTKIFSESNQNIVGSIGTMIEFEGVAANTEIDGVKFIRLYATKSTEKNKAFEEALNNDNYKLLVSELLDPINENFIAMVESNRPQLKGTNFDNGHTVFSKDAIGTFIDGIASFNEVVQMVLEDSKNYNSSSNLSLINSQKKMTKEELKQSHPELYSSVVSEGAHAERERVASWMVYANTDLEAVTQGIKGGSEISASQREEFMVKMNSAAMLKNLQSDSAPAIVVNEATVVSPDAPVVDAPVENEYMKFVKKS
jgi:ClpP class serine protease